MTYFDRWGKPHTPKPGDVVKDRSGIFAMLYHTNHILVCYAPYARQVAELPGGGIDKGEDKDTALWREVFEETGFHIENPKITKRLENFVKFYTEDKNEFWNYTQTIYAVDATNQNIFFDGVRDTPENGKTQWLHIDDIPDTTFRHMHIESIQPWLQEMKK